jgi:hypothetical protein
MKRDFKCLMNRVLWNFLCDLTAFLCQVLCVARNTNYNIFRSISPNTIWPYFQFLDSFSFEITNNEINNKTIFVWIA